MLISGYEIDKRTRAIERRNYKQRRRESWKRRALRQINFRHDRMEVRNKDDPSSVGRPEASVATLFSVCD